MSIEIRPLTEDELGDGRELSRIAFGGERPAPDQQEKLTIRPGYTDWGLFDSGRLVAKAGDREQQHWFGGRSVPASGLGGVAATPEWRGGGVAGRLLTRVLAETRARGAAVCTLYRTIPGVYRRLGFEDVGVGAWMTFQTLGLGMVRRPAGREVRPAEVADVPALSGLYERIAASRNGMMERSGPLFDQPAAEWLRRFDGVTVTEGPDGIDGYACWRRGTGYSIGARLTVPELVACSDAAMTTLLANLASWNNALPTTALWQPQGDPMSWALPVDGVCESLATWMLRVIDAPAAVATRGWSSQVSGAAELELTDEVCPWNAGRWRLSVADGRGILERGGSGTVQLGPRGFALLYGGGVPVAALRRAGLLTGGSTMDSWLDAVIGGPTPALLDTF